MEKESSLTTPSDRNQVDKWRPEQGMPSLPEDTVNVALSDLVVKPVYPQIDRVYVDPPLNMQNIGLVSFVPSRGARPDENGLYGFAKFRGCFASEMEADQRAEYLIRNVDSYHKIYYPRVGHPFPITTESRFSAVQNDVDIRKTVAQEFSHDIKKQKDSDQQQIKEIQEREKLLKEDVSRDVPDPYDEYITLKVKKAQITWTYLEHLKKIEELKHIIRSTRERLIVMDVEYPLFKDQYYQKYLDARKDAGLKESPDDGDSFMRFLIEEAILPGIDTSE
jgi:hypothetical protein